MDPVAASTLLNSLALGSPVAEHDAALATYFIETDTFTQLVEDKGDVVAGDKGTGKTALFTILTERYGVDREGDEVVVSAFNPAGTPIFSRLLDAGELNEAQYTAVWKTYVFSLAANWLLDYYKDVRTGRMNELEDMLQSSGLRVTGATPKSAFNKMLTFLRGPSAVETMTTFTPDGIPIFANKLVWEKVEPPADAPVSFLRHDDALELLEECLADAAITLWVAFDRLDEAFQAHPAIEKPALRALLRAYLDLSALQRVRLKLFVRRDLFSRIVDGGFVNLTHVNARRITITWEDKDLYSLLFRRLIESEDFQRLTGFSRKTPPEQVFAFVFPERVDPGEKKPLTWKWILTRIRDGNDVKSPRNLVDLITRAVAAQKRREAQSPRLMKASGPLITADALKQAQAELSRDRVEDTLLAEAGDSAAAVKAFANGKAEHNMDSLRKLFGDEASSTLDRLTTLGFFEPSGRTWKVPPLYRPGLSISQGKAFSDPKSDEADEGED